MHRSFVSSVASAASFAVRPAELSHDLHAQIGVPGATLVILNTVIGGGISLIAIPFAAKELGLVTFVVADVLFAALTACSLHFLATVATDLQVFNFQEILVKLIGTWAGKLTSLSIWLNNFGIIIAFLQTGLDIVEVFMHNGPHICSLLIGGLVVAIAPLCALAHVDRLASIALVCSVLCFLFCGILIANLFAAEVEDHAATDWVWSASFTNVFLGKGLPAMNLAWTCQFNAVPLFGSLASCTVPTMDAVSVSSALASAALYASFGVAVYLSFGSLIQNDMMKNIDPSSAGTDIGEGFALPRWIAFATEAILGVSILGTIPFFFIECRNMGHQFLFGGEARSRFVRWGETVFLLALCYLIAVGVDDLSIVLALVGVIPANIIAWFLPSAAFLAWRKGEGGANKHPSALAIGPACLACLSLGVFCALLPLGLLSIFR